MFLSCASPTRRATPRLSRNKRARALLVDAIERGKHAAMIVPQLRDGSRKNRLERLVLSVST